MLSAILAYRDRQGSFDTGRGTCRLALLVLSMIVSVLALDSGFAATHFDPLAERPTKPLDVWVVRNADPSCTPDRCTDWIALNGPIGPGSARKFAQVVGALGHRRLPVLINSPGGLVAEAMQIGRLIREKHLDVAVTRTIVASCPSDRKACEKISTDGVLTGAPEPRQSICASACPLILAAGTRRFVAPWAHVGVHQYIGFKKEMKVRKLFRVLTRYVDGAPMVVSKTLVSVTPLPDTARVVRSQVRYEDTESYFARMGIGSDIMTLLQSAPAQGMRWLTSAELTGTKLATDPFDGEFLVAHSNDVPAAPVAVSVVRAPPADTPDPTTLQSRPAAREIAALIDDSGSEVESFSGHATWSVDRGGSRANGTGDVGLLANVDLDNDAGSLSFRLDREHDEKGHPVTRLLIRLLHGGNSPFRHILAVERPDMRKDPHASTDALAGLVEDSPPAVLSMDLSDTPQDAAKDMALLSSDQWIDVPIKVDDRAVRVSFALGSSGTQAFRQWRDSACVRASR